MSQTARLFGFHQTPETSNSAPHSASLFGKSVAARQHGTVVKLHKSGSVNVQTGKGPDTFQ